MVGKQWHALCNSHCVPNPRRPPRSNPLFLLFVRSRLPLPIGCVSSGPRERQEEPTDIVVPLARARTETKKQAVEGEWDKCFNCSRNADSLGKCVLCRKVWVVNANKELGSYCPSRIGTTQIRWPFLDKCGRHLPGGSLEDPCWRLGSIIQACIHGFVCLFRGEHRSKGREWAGGGGGRVMEMQG